MRQGTGTSAAHRHARKEQEKARERIQTRNRVEKTFRTKLRQELRTKNSHSEFWTKISCKTFPAEVAEKVREILGPSVPSAAKAGRSARVPRKNAEQIPGGGHRPTRPPGKIGQHFPLFKGETKAQATARRRNLEPFWLKSSPRRGEAL